MKNLLLLSLMACFMTPMAQIDISRDVIGSAGAVFIGSNMQASFTVGETFTQTLSNSEIHTLGFQQIHKRDFSLVSDIPLEIGFFPNPATDYVSFVLNEPTPYSYKVVDVMGKVVLEGSSIKKELTLDISDLCTGKYFFAYTIDHETNIAAFLIIH